MFPGQLRGIVISNDIMAKEAAKNCIKDCMGTKKDENVLIISDPPRLDLAELMRDEAKKLGANAEIILLPHPEVRKFQPLNTPSGILLAAISCSDVILNFFELIPFELSPFRITLIEKAKKAGRVGHMVGVTRSSFEHGLLADYSKIAEYSDTLATILSKGKNITIRSGPDLEHTLSFGDIGGWHEIATSECGIFTEKGSFGNLPAGEAYIAISPARSVFINGSICVDNFISEVGHIDPAKPVLLTVTKGEVTNIERCEPTEGFDPTRKFADNLKRAENEARDRGLDPQYVRKIAEIGIGTNPMAFIGDSIIETEKRMGTLHIALGRNTSLGGTYEAPNHYDCVLSRVKLEINGRTILEKGKLKDLRSLRKEFEDNYLLMPGTKIEGESIITKVSTDVLTKEKDGKLYLYKKWTDFAGRTHHTEIGGDDTSQKAAQLWQQMANQETVAALLDKVDLKPKMVYQLLCLLEQYLLVNINEKTEIDYLKELRSQTGSNFVELSNLLKDFSVRVEKGYEQERINLKQILDNITELDKNLAISNLNGITEGIKQIEIHIDELMRRDSDILSSKVTVSGGIGPFLNVSGEIDLRKLLTKIREKLSSIKNKL